MAKINSIHHDGREITLIPKGSEKENENSFTVLIGKNGVGKSRLLSSIAKYMNFAADSNSILDSRITSSHMLGGSYYFNSNIIAVSTSPFDKFPNPKKRSSEDEKTHYKYIGMRADGIYAPSSSIALISSAARGLLEKLNKQSNNENLLSVFDTLGFEPTVELMIKPSYIGKESISKSSGFFDDSSLHIELQCLERDYGIVIEERYREALRGLSTPKRHKVFQSIRTINKILKVKKSVELKIDFSDGSSHLEGAQTDSEYLEALLALMKYGFMRLMDLRLDKNGHGDLSLRLASSGEQCLLVIMLGIAGNIKHDSVILIDEPEVSLHPRWQEEFMLLLTSAFSSYKNCHFIIATHSPQLISRLQKENCYITSLSKNQTYRSSEFLQRSADFQLAELFDAPGLMNEYISRLAFNLLAKIRKSKRLDEENISNLQKLIGLSKNLEKNDPTLELIESVKLACEYYANN